MQLFKPDNLCEQSARSQDKTRVDNVEDGEAEDHGKEVQDVEVDFVCNPEIKSVSTITRRSARPTDSHPSLNER